MAEKFSYNYSADKNEEIKKIREKYEVKTDEENEILGQIKKLDAKVETPAKIIGIVWGLAFTLIFGSGLALCITKTGSAAFYIGIVLGLIGMCGMAFSPKISKAIFEKRKAKFGAQILELTDKALGIKK